MKQYFENQGFRTYVFAAELEDLNHHLARGRPLIVCLENDALHYVVVAGIDPATTPCWLTTLPDENLPRSIGRALRKAGIGAKTGLFWRFRRSSKGARLLWFFMVLFHAWDSRSQDIPPSRADLPEKIKTLFVEKRWAAILQLAPESENYPPDLDYYRGMAFASLEQWPEAERCFRKGQNKAPSDERFPLELAGIAFKQGNRSEARALVRRALRLDSDDTYANDFLATLYFLSGNVEAALKYWNRIRKPTPEEIRSDPHPRVNPVLLDRAFAAAPASHLTIG